MPPPEPGQHSRAPAVSVVLPAYNYAHYVGKAIASVLAQTFPGYELLVIDDGSTDGTHSVVSGFTDPRLRYLRQENAGLSAARNTGIREARGEFIAFLDADDLWLPRFLEVVVQQFATLGPAYGLAAAASTRIDADGSRIPPSKHGDRFLSRGELTVRHFILRNRPPPSAIVVRRQVFADVGHFDTRLRSSEDRDMWIRATMRHRFWQLDEALVLIRRHPANMSKHAPRMERNSRRTLLLAFARRAAPRWELSLWLRAAAVHYFLVAWTHFDAGMRARALAFLACSVAAWPWFLKPGRIAEPHLFRVRALLAFFRPGGTGSTRGNPVATQAGPLQA